MSDVSQSEKVRAALSAAVAAIGGAPRNGQIEMAEAVANSITDNHHLLVQAGTGTGKSLAYIVPPVALEKRVLVATATLALQRQLVERDLPRVIPALSEHLGRPITYAIYKGIGNYLCLQKMNTTVDDPDQEVLTGMGKLESQTRELRAWAAEPDCTGDRDDAPEVDRRVWSAHSVTGRECIGADKCTFGSQCFSVKAKAKAQGADVVVTNHTLLAIEIVDDHPILPDRDLVVLDEAHEFVDRTTQAVTEELSVGQIERAASMARKHLDRDRYEPLMAAIDDYADAVADFAQKQRDDFSLQGRLLTLPIEHEVRELNKAVEAAVASMNLNTDNLDEATAGMRAKSALVEIQTITTKMLASSERKVLWFDSYGKTFQLAPLDVSGVLRKNLLRDVPVVGTSATLTVGRNFDVLARSMGFDLEESDSDVEGVDPSNVQMIDVGSPFDFANQGMLYLPKHLPEPTRDGISLEALDELGALITAAGGRTLALFSSWRSVETAESFLSNMLPDDINLIVQRRGDPTGPLVDRFAADETSVLIGTLTLWQGVDVPGRSCTVVAIDRIPFPRPDEPVMSARAAAVDAAGGSGFAAISLPRAALLLAQGAGRLIRSTEDRGVVAILDSRIVNKRYGSTLLNSMPGFWRTSDLGTVVGALERLRQS